MTTEIKYPFHPAYKAASYILELLRPHCHKIHLAGSIRRLRPEVKDIEIVCHPKTEVKLVGLFDDPENIIDRNFTEALATITDIILMGNVDGRYMKIRTNSKGCPGIVLDLFLPDPRDYYRQYAIRTGSADYAHNFIAAAWKRKGWVGVQDVGLRMMSQCVSIRQGDKTIYKLNPQFLKYETPPVWESEGQFFAWLGIEYKDPEHREIHKPVNEAP